MNNNNQPLTWSFSGLWNGALEKREERILEVRQHIWASELGGSFIDRYLKMNGIKQSNPPNPRSLRKFEAGNIWEYIAGFVLKRAGILIDNQNHVKYEYPGLLPVTGKLDYLAGGKPNFDAALHAIDTELTQLFLPESIVNGARAIVTGLKERFGTNELKEIVIEIKSCSSFMFDVYERSGSANPNHRLQIYHYLKSTGRDEGHIVYICKDDCRMLEIGVMCPSPVEDEYRGDIDVMTRYIKDEIQPPLERAVVFDRDFGKFSANWKVAYSGYLTHLYGIKNQMEFDNVYKPKAQRWNRVLKRAVQVALGELTPKGKPITLTKDNMEVISEMRADFPNYDEILHIATKHKEMLDERNAAEDVQDEEESETVAVT